MNCKISVTSDFLKDMKRLSKHYRSLKSDLKELQKELSNNPFAGVDLGHWLRKVRMAITSKNKGKSGGARIITCTLLLKELDSELILVTMYDKSERDSISEGELVALLERNGLL